MSDTFCKRADVLAISVACAIEVAPACKAVDIPVITSSTDCPTDNATSLASFAICL